MFLCASVWAEMIFQSQAEARGDYPASLGWQWRNIHCQVNNYILNCRLERADAVCDFNDRIPMMSIPVILFAPYTWERISLCRTLIGLVCITYSVLLDKEHTNNGKACHTIMYADIFMVYLQESLSQNQHWQVIWFCIYFLLYQFFSILSYKVIKNASQFVGAYSYKIQ